MLLRGAPQMLTLGYGTEQDIEHCEEGGHMAAADASLVSERAKQRGHDQLGTLGSGNHFLEVQEVVEIYNPSVARTFGLELGMVYGMIHCGSWGLGHQTATDYIRMMLPYT